MLSKEKLELFKKRVNSGQSPQMLRWEFKLKDREILKLCKEHSLMLNASDSVFYANKVNRVYVDKVKKSKK